MFQSYQEAFLKKRNLEMAVKNDVTLTIERDRVRNLYSQGFVLSNLGPVWPSAQPDGDFGKLSLLMMHLLINLYICNSGIHTSHSFAKLTIVSHGSDKLHE